MTKVAVIGSGAAGLTAAWILQHLNQQQVTLFEKQNRFGGHALTTQCAQSRVDVGFQVFNLTTYSYFVQFFRELNVETIESDMSFSVSIKRRNGTNFEWSSGGLNTIFTTISSFMEIDRYKLIKDILRFGYLAPKLSKAGQTVKQFVEDQGFSDIFIKGYLEPLIGAIWSVSNSTALDCDLESMTKFMINHHLLNTVSPRPQWRTLKYRSEDYVKKVIDQLHDTRSNCFIETISQTDEGVVILDEHKNEYEFDKVILAVHSEDILQMLDEDFKEEKAILSKIHYQSNRCVLHRDELIMPENRKLWSSWNATVLTGSTKPIVTYWINLLQDIPESEGNMFLTVNPPEGIKSIVNEWELKHPILTCEAAEAQVKLQELQQRTGKERKVFFTGAWCRYGFHEDAFIASVNAISSMGLKLPSWTLHSPNPKESLSSKFTRNIVKRYLQSVLKTGSLRLILPNGSEMHTNQDTLENTLTLRIWDYNFFKRMMSGLPGISAAECYMEGLFDVDGDLVQFMDLFAKNVDTIDENQSLLGPLQWITGKLQILNHFYRARNTLKLAKQNIQRHYDLGNEMYSMFLDPSMTYSSAFFLETDLDLEESLEEAQYRKLDRILQKAQIAEEHKVLEIGCGWGSMAINAVKKTGCSWIGLTLSKQQKLYCDKLIAESGLTDKITILLKDFRELAKDQRFYHAFDRVVSIEMIEALGKHNFDIYYKSISTFLKPLTGRAVIQAITIPDIVYDKYCKQTDFIRTHIFPGGHLPSFGAMKASSNPYLKTCCVESLSAHYVKTLYLWRKAFNLNSEKLEKLGYDSYFQRKFNWYFAFCESGFRYRVCNVLQIEYESRYMSESPSSSSSSFMSGTVYHCRNRVKDRTGTVHAFRYKTIMTLLNLQELELFFSNKPWASLDSCWNLVSFIRKDYLGNPKQPLEESVRDLIELRLGFRPNGQVYLLTMLRSFGFGFNPISVYYCVNSSNCLQLDAMIAEVSNTPWNEKTYYAFDLREEKQDDNLAYIVQCPKEMHVSPYFDMDYTYLFRIKSPVETVQFSVELYDKKEIDQEPIKVFEASVNLIPARNISIWNCGIWLYMLFMTFLTQLWIHKQALNLTMKGERIFYVKHKGYSELPAIQCTWKYMKDLMKFILIFLIGFIATMLLRIAKTLGYQSL